MDDNKEPKSNRYTKMFDLLRQGNRRPDPFAGSRSAAIAARYLEGDAANSFITRSVASLKAHSTPQPEKAVRLPLGAFAKFRPSSPR